MEESKFREVLDFHFRSFSLDPFRGAKFLFLFFRFPRCLFSAGGRETVESIKFASNLRLSIGDVIACFYFHPQYYEYHYVFPVTECLKVTSRGVNGYI